MYYSVLLSSEDRCYHKITPKNLGVSKKNNIFTLYTKKEVNPMQIEYKLHEGNANKSQEKLNTYQRIFNIQELEGKPSELATQSWELKFQKTNFDEEFFENLEKIRIDQYQFSYRKILSSFEKEANIKVKEQIENNESLQGAVGGINILKTPRLKQIKRHCKREDCASHCLSHTSCNTAYAASIEKKMIYNPHFVCDDMFENNTFTLVLNGNKILSCTISCTMYLFQGTNYFGSHLSGIKGIFGIGDRIGLFYPGALLRFSMQKMGGLLAMKDCALTSLHSVMFPDEMCCDTNFFTERMNIFTGVNLETIKEELKDFKPTLPPISQEEILSYNEDPRKMNFYLVFEFTEGYIDTFKNNVTKIKHKMQSFINNF